MPTLLQAIRISNHQNEHFLSKEQKRFNKPIQQVNIAYEKNDLLQLLEIQLQAEQINQSDLVWLSDDRLKHNNKLLNDQCEGLQKNEPCLITNPRSI